MAAWFCDDVAPSEPAPQEDDDDHLMVADLVRTTPEDAEPAPAEDAAREPNGHVNPDGILYREPRKPFTRTEWNALKLRRSTKRTTARR